MVGQRCVFCDRDEISLDFPADCPGRSADDSPLAFSSPPGIRWVVRTESGSAYLFDLAAMTATRLPANRGGEPIPLTVWADQTHRADGRLRADEQAVPMVGLPEPWPPVEGESMTTVLELMPGVLTVRTTSTVTERIMHGD